MRAIMCLRSAIGMVRLGTSCRSHSMLWASEMDVNFAPPSGVDVFTTEDMTACQDFEQEEGSRQIYTARVVSFVQETLNSPAQPATVPTNRDVV